MQEGDVVRFDYVLRVQGEDKPLETSMEEAAKEYGIHHQKQYQPLTITMGRQQILPALEKQLQEKAKVGETQKFALTAAEAYGDRDPSRIQNVPMAQFRKEKVQPQVGMELNLQGQRGVITRVAGGRVRVDMNHELAGKDLEYEITIRDVISDPQEKLEAVMGMLFPMGGHKLEVTDDAVTVELPDQVKFDQNWGQHKFRVLTELRAAAGTNKDVLLVERYPAMPDNATEEE